MTNSLDHDQPDSVWPPAPSISRQAAPGLTVLSSGQINRYVVAGCLFEGIWRGTLFGALHLGFLYVWLFWLAGLSGFVSFLWLGFKLGFASGLAIGIVNALVLIPFLAGCIRRLQYADDIRPDLRRTVNRIVLLTTAIAGVPVFTVALMVVGFRLRCDNGFPQALVAANILACVLAVHAANRSFGASAISMRAPSANR